MSMDDASRSDELTPDEASDAADDPLDREVCMCYHVPLRKIVRFHRLRSPRVVSQLSQCHGAGTGCGWCIPILERIFEQLERGETPQMKMSAAEYRARRARYRTSGDRSGE